MYQVSAGEKSYEISFSEGTLLIDDKPFVGDLSKISDRNYHLILAGKSYRIEILDFNHKSKSYTFRINNQIITSTVKDKMDLLLERLGFDDQSADSLDDLKAPMPGLLLDIHVKEGDQITKGTPLLILEAMKMENVIKADGDGIVSQILVKKGDSVEKNQLLIAFDKL